MVVENSNYLMSHDMVTAHPPPPLSLHYIDLLPNTADALGVGGCDWVPDGSSGVPH